jgi:putative tryptophan/tyrosine transport system substrate-binding protein
MRRRDFIKAITISVAWPLAAHAQEKTDDLPRIGILHTFPNENFEALTEGLREARYIDGQNVLLEKRFYGAALDRIN